MNGLDFVKAVLAVYVIVRVLTGGSILQPFRRWIEVNWHEDFPTCRLCVGFWVALVYCAWGWNFVEVLPVYGGSYFLARIEPV